MLLKTIGVIGGGVMGVGIVHTLLNAGYRVRFKELDQTLVDSSIKRVEKIFESLRKKGMISEVEAKGKMASIVASTDYGILADADLVIEAVPERIEIKGETLREADRTCKPDAIFASNTSSLSISELGGITTRPSSVIGMHWFNPAHIMKLIEVVPGIETSQETIQVVLQLSKGLGKLPILVKECAGFLVNRLLGIYMNEAMYLLQEGHKPKAVDWSAQSLGIPMGPLKLGDMVGWDTIYHANRTLQEEYGSRFALPALLEEIYKTNRWGTKVAKGFYQYRDGRIVEEAAEEDTLASFLPDRLLYGMINEGIRCLDEKVASREDVDRSLVIGAGMPKGPLQWADEIGLDMILRKLQEYKTAYGERFLPSPLLKRMVAAKRLGRKARIGFYNY